MKKVLFISALAVIAAVGCSKEIAPAPAGKTVLTVNAPETKTAFGEESEGMITVIWSKDDVLNVNGANSDALTEGGSASAQFSFSETLEAPYYAAYPASAVSNYSNGTATITLPAEQTYVANSFDPAAGILLGTASEEGAITMKNAVAYLRIEPVGAFEAIATIEVTANGGEPLCGTFTTDYQSLTAAGSNTSTVKVKCNGTAVYEKVVVALPAQTYTQGFTVKVTGKDGAVNQKSSTKQVVMAAGHLYPTSVKVTEDKYYLVGGGFSKYTDWVIQKDLALVPVSDGVYKSAKNIYLDKWCYFRIATADWNEDYSRKVGAANYWTAQPKAEGDEEPFIPGNADGNWKEGEYEVVFNRNNMTVTCTYIPGEVDPDVAFYIFGWNFGEYYTEWAFNEGLAMMPTSDGVYETVKPAYLLEWCYFKFEKQDWTEYVRDQTTEDYWKVTARTYDPDNDSGFSPGQTGNKDGWYNVKLDLNTKSVTLTATTSE